MNVINFENVENELCRLSAAGHYYSAAPSAADASDVARQPLLTAAESRRYRVYVEQALRVAVAAVRAWLKDLSWTDAGVTFSAPAAAQLRPNEPVWVKQSSTFLPSAILAAAALLYF